MTSILSKTLLEQQGAPVYMVPCTVTTVTPLTISLLGAVGVLGVKVAGATYSLGPANALITSPGTPLVLPIG